MSGTLDDIHALRHIVLDSQHLLEKSSDSIETMTSELCGLQYDPYPAIHLNQYLVLWNRIRDFRAEQLDTAAYQDFRVVETWTFKRNMFFVPRDEYALYRHATKGIVRWGDSDESWLAAGDSPETRAAEEKLKESLMGFDGLTANQIWEKLDLSFEWNRYRREHDQSYHLPIFRAFYRLTRRGDLLTCGRKPGTFKEPVWILREKVGLPDWTKEPMDEERAIQWAVEKLVSSLGVTDPVHVSHLSGYRTADLLPVFEKLESDRKICRLPHKIGRKQYYVHASHLRVLHEKGVADGREVRLLSPMDAIVRDKAWLEALFDYSFSFEYFKKKGMKWPLSILVGHQFVGYVDCKMDWKGKKWTVKERHIFHPDFRGDRRIDEAIEELAAFHGAKEIVEEG